MQDFKLGLGWVNLGFPTMKDIKLGQFATKILHCEEDFPTMKDIKLVLGCIKAA